MINSDLDDVIVPQSTSTTATPNGNAGNATELASASATVGVSVSVRVLVTETDTEHRTISHCETGSISNSNNINNRQTNIQNNTSNDTDNDDNETVIYLDSVDDPNQTGNYNGGGGPSTLDWMEPVSEEHRRTILLQELHRVQRAAFVQFLTLCMFPVFVIIFVVLTVVGDETLCDSIATECYLEPRTFINAFTTRCVCQTIPLLRTNDTTTSG